MKLLLTHPTSWPWVRRGSERLLNDLGVDLLRRGHAVTVLSRSPDGPGQRVEGGVNRMFVPERLTAISKLRQLNGFHAFAYDVRRVLMTLDVDAVHCLNYHDAYGALLARKASGRQFRIVYQMTGVPIARYFRSIPIDRMMFRRVIRDADDVIVLSRFAQDCMKRDFGRAGTLIPSPTETRNFATVVRSQPARPRVLFVGDLNEPRKGARLLAQAFAAVHAAQPEVELHYSGSGSDATQAEILANLPAGARRSVVFHGLGAVDDLPGLYASASVVVNPAIWEALGNVLIEALACGSPIVGANHAGIRDIITDPRIGVLFDPGPMTASASNHAGLAEAIVAALALSRKPETAAACRAHAEHFGWKALGGRYEATLLGQPMHTLQHPGVPA